MQNYNHHNLLCLLFTEGRCKRRWATMPVALFSITKEYKAACVFFYFLFFAIWMWKSPRFFLCQWIKMPTLLKVTCALCPQEKAAKIPAVEADRSISQVFPSLSYPSPAGLGIISLDRFYYMLSLRKHFFVVLLCLFT